MSLEERIRSEMEKQVAEEGDSQPLPTEGKKDVFPEAFGLFQKMHQERFDSGLKRYGKTLQTHNGRNAGMDAHEELFDAFVYIMQMRMEHEDLGRMAQSQQDSILRLVGRIESAKAKLLKMQGSTTDQEVYAALQDVLSILEV